MDILASARKAEAVTPSDTVDLSGGTARALYVGGAGDVVVVMDGQDITWAGMPAGGYIQAFVTRVKSTGTTATNILALY